MLLNLILALILLLVPAPKANSEIMSGKIVLHNAFPAILRNFPERIQPDVDGYIAVTDCAEIGTRYTLVRAGQPDALVAVADCAWPRHAAYRAQMGYIADVDAELWTGPELPQPAELWPPELRAAYWQDQLDEQIERLFIQPR